MLFITIYSRIVFDKPLKPRALKVNANPQKNEQDSEKDTLPERDPEKSLMSTSSSRIVKSTRNKNFKYLFMLPSLNMSSPSVASALRAHLHPNFLTSTALKAHLFLMPSLFSFHFNQGQFFIQSFRTSSMPFSLRQEARIRREQRAWAEQLGLLVYWILHLNNIELIAFMYKPINMLYILDFERQSWISAFDGATLTQFLQRGDQWPCPPHARELTDPEVEIRQSMVKFPGFDQGHHKRRRYGYSDKLKHFTAARAQWTAAPQFAHPPQSSGTLRGDSFVAFLKAPQMPVASPAFSTIAFGAGWSPSLATMMAFASRAGDLLNRPPAAAPFF